MNTESLWQISVRTSPEAEDAVAALLERLFGQPASIYSTPEGRDSLVTVYSTRSTERAHAKKKALEAGLKFVADSGLNISPAEIFIGKVRREDWAESWKKYFKTIEIGPELLIKPSWSPHEPRKGQAVVVLDPGLSFGTGQHATTLFCLRQIVACRNPQQSQSFLDIGTGSGILAISAVKLGYKPVRAFDFDPVAVRIAKANARKNRVTQALSITRNDLTRLPEESKTRYDLISANLLDDLLISESQRILNRLQPSGRIVVSGILIRQFPSVQKAYEAAGMEMLHCQEDGEWKSGLFRFRESPDGASSPPPASSPA